MPMMKRLGRGALETSTTVEPAARTFVSASQAAGKAATPLCSTPQTSQRIRS